MTKLSYILHWLLHLLEQFLAWAGFIQKSPPSSASTEVKTQPRTELKLGANVPPEYRKSKSIFTYRESTFYYALIRAVDETRYQVFAKVRLADFIWLANEPEERRFHQNQILCKHVDFLLCDKQNDLTPALVIELDDSSHNLPDHQARDKFKNDLFALVGLPLLRMDLQSKYSSNYLRQQINEKLKELPKTTRNS